VAGAVGGRGQIEQPEVTGMHQPDSFPAIGAKCRKFHAGLLLFSDKIYDQKKYR
jgi:hypothetical protein